MSKLKLPPIQFIQIKSLLLLLTLLAGCSNKSSKDELTKELQTVTSWAATAQMTGDAWSRGSVPTAYAKQTLSTAQEKLHEETDTLLTSTDSTQRRTILEHLQRLETTVKQMSRAVEQGDHAALAQELKQLSTQEQIISTLGRQNE